MLDYFRVYAAQTLSDENFQGWSVEERGAWFTLILVAWREGSIPGDQTSLAKLLHVDGGAMRGIWSAIGSRFIDHPDHPGRLTSPRLEMEREKAESAYEKKVDAGRQGANSRWAKAKRKHGRPMAVPSQPDSTEVGTAWQEVSPSLLPTLLPSLPDQPAIPIIVGSPVAIPGWLAGIAERLSLELGRTLAVGKDAASVVEAFSRRREHLAGDDRADPDSLIVGDCLEIAKRSKVGPPGTLSFFVGWLNNATPRHAGGTP